MSSLWISELYILLCLLLPGARAVEGDQEGSSSEPGWPPERQAQELQQETLRPQGARAQPPRKVPFTFLQCNKPLS